MQVNIFIARDDQRSPHALLVLPFGPMAAIPHELRHLDWEHFVTTMTDDKLLGASAKTIEAELARSGFALVQPTG
jgi:hypothetical protein